MNTKVITTGLSLLALGAIVVGVLLYLMGAASPPREPSASASVVPPAATPNSTSDLVVPRSKGDSLARYVSTGSGLGERPKSLGGTTVDGELSADDNGQLIISPGVRRVFDYFLTTIGEEDFEMVKSRLARYIDSHLPPEAAQQAWALFGQYMGLKEALSDLPPYDGTLESMRTVMMQRQALRQSWFDLETNDAFYGPENAYDEFQLSRREIVENSALTEAEKQQRLESLTDALPRTFQHMVTATQAPLKMDKQVAKLREQGASEAEISALRVRSFGVEAANRLERLDQQRTQWDQRYSDYRRQRQTILASGLAEQDRATQIQRLQEQSFDAGEIRRAQALDRIGRVAGEN
ncbi:MAG: lipase secretion chaperone [Marinobacter sp.]|uniref:lipase secretion chaperone n=1 Tax=Marinobacter sp. TaxID=50741 RepID=UPI0034A04026